MKLRPSVIWELTFASKDDSEKLTIKSKIKKHQILHWRKTLKLSCYETVIWWNAEFFNKKWEHKKTKSCKLQISVQNSQDLLTITVTFHLYGVFSDSLRLIFSLVGVGDLGFPGYFACKVSLIFQSLYICGPQLHEKVWFKILILILVWTL